MCILRSSGIEGTYSSYSSEGTSRHIVTVYRRKDTIAPVTTNSTSGRMISVSSAFIVALVSRLGFRF